MNIDVKLQQVLANLDRSLPAEFKSVEDVIRAIDARGPGEIEAWLDKIAPKVAGDTKADFRAALQAAATLAKESGVPLAELKKRAAGRVEGAAIHEGVNLAGEGAAFTKPGDAAEQKQRLDTIQRDYVQKARAAGQPLPNIGLDEKFKSADQTREYIGGLLSGDMLYWAKNAFEETASIERAKSPEEMRGVILGIDYSHYTGGGGPYLDYMVAKLDNTFSMKDIVDIVGNMKHYRYPLSVDSQVSFMVKLLERRAGDKPAIEQMLRDVRATEGNNQSTIVARSFLGKAYDANKDAAAILDKLGFEKHGLDMFGPITGKTYPNPSATENLAKMASERPEFKAFEATLGKEPKRVEKAVLLAAIDKQMAKLKTPEEFVAFALAFTGEDYGYQFKEGRYRDDPRWNILWDVMQKHHGTAAKLGVSFDWMANLFFAAYSHSIRMMEHGIIFEDALKVLEPLMKYLKTPDQTNRFTSSADHFIQGTYINQRQYYEKNYQEAWKKLQDTAISHLAENFETPQIGKTVVTWCGTVPDAIKAKRRILQLAGDNLPDIQTAMKLHFQNPSEVYVKDNERFVLDNVRKVTAHPAFDLQALEELLGVQQFLKPALESILAAVGQAPAFANWSGADKDAARAKFAAGNIDEAMLRNVFGG